MAHYRHLGVLGAFAAGALVATAVGSIRSARAEGDRISPAGYFCFQASNVTDLQTKANAAAQRGWRMVEGIGQPNASLWCFEPR